MAAKKTSALIRRAPLNPIMPAHLLTAEPESKKMLAPLPRPAAPSRSGLWLALIAIAFIAVGGIVLALWLRDQWIGQPDPSDGYNVFFVLFSRHEPACLAIVLAFSALTGLWLWRGKKLDLHPLPVRTTSVYLIAAAAFALATAGYYVVFHEYSLTADENMADWQARIFLSGHLRAVIPPFWEPMVRLIMPVHAYYLPQFHSWNSGYLPVYAAIRAAFMPVELQSLVNPLCAALSVCLIAAVARQIWPNDKLKPLLAAALLAASSQFLVMSMTAYAMPAHLALNLLWLWLYLAPQKRRFWLAPFIGIAALGLHQPFFHALFVTPFLARLVWERRWKTSCYFALIYLAGIACWYAWWQHFNPSFSGGGSNSAFGIHRYTWMFQVIYLSLVVGWLALPIPLLATLGFANLRRQKPVLWDAAFSCLLTFGFYVFVRLDQAHGWGDRYFHGAIGCLILVALVGWDALVRRAGRQTAGLFVVVGLTLSLLVQFPLRCFQAEKFVAPYAHAAAELQNSNADLVGFNPLEGWYISDLIRNDPFLRHRPVMVSIYSLQETEAARLQKRFAARRLVTKNKLKQFGLATEPF